MSKILHLIPDEKIVNRIIKIFHEALPEQHLFVVTSRRKKYSYVQTGAAVISLDEFNCMSHEAIWTGVQAVIIHNLTHRALKVADKHLPKGMPCYWVIWGMDLYHNLLQPKGFPIYDKHNPFTCLLTCDLRKLSAIFRAHKVRKFVLNKVTHIMTDTTDIDYDMLVQHYPEMAGKPHVPFFYYPLDEILGPLVNHSVETFVDKDHFGGIQVGNSCSPTNNHIYVFDILCRLNLFNRPVRVPLSYSVRDYYKKAVVKEGESCFGYLFQPLYDFMPLDEYNRMQCENTVAIYGSFRQEAIGNILTSLYLGAKVFLPKLNPIHEWARSIGIDVFVLEDITQESLVTPLSFEQKLVHRERLMDLYNKERMIALIQDEFGE